MILGTAAILHKFKLQDWWSVLMRVMYLVYTCIESNVKAGTVTRLP